jgi:hypothetical protein
MSSPKFLAKYGDTWNERKFCQPKSRSKFVQAGCGKALSFCSCSSHIFGIVNMLYVDVDPRQPTSTKAMNIERNFIATFPRVVGPLVRPLTVGQLAIVRVKD